MLSVAGPLLRPLAAWAAAPSPVPRFAYVACDGDPKGAIHVFQVPARGAWRPVQSVASRAPSSLAVTNDGRTLFVANRVSQYRNRPAGSVEAYRIDPATGKLQLLSRRSLALSAVNPQHVAVSPDGKFLVVCASGGGAYNLLPIHADGSLGGVAILRKETGSSVDAMLQSSSRPQEVVFDERGRIVASDLGADRLSVFEIREDELAVNGRHAARPGCGPSAMQLNRDLSVLFAAGALDGTVAAHAYDQTRGTFLDKTAVSRAAPLIRAARVSTLAVDPSGELVAASWSDGERHGISMLRFDGGAFSFAPAHAIETTGATLSVQFIGGGDRLIAANSKSGVVSAFEVDASGRLQRSADLAHCEGPRAISFTYI
jgi:6-phosphogluconolactonase (cycloisomerase 2 family)